VPQIEVTFDIDANGILNVSAKDMGTGKENKITITANSGLSEEEIKKMMEDAQAHAEEDKAKKEAIDIKNRADSMVYTCEKQIKENGDKMPAELKSQIEDYVAQLKKAIEANDTAKMDSVMKDLEAKMHAFAEELYKNAQAQQGGAGAGPQGGFGGGASNNGGKDDDTVIDVNDKE
jgi:molecular chaperone DnaK